MSAAYHEDLLESIINTNTKTDIYCKHRDRCVFMIKFLKEERKKNDEFSAKTE